MALEMATLGKKRVKTFPLPFLVSSITLSCDFEVLNAKKSYQIFYYDQTDALLKFSPLGDFGLETQ